LQPFSLTTLYLLKNVRGIRHFLYLYVDAIIKKILEKNFISESRIKNKTCWIVAEDKEAENMALKPNMTIYIPSEVIKQSRSEDELAFKLAHELSHFLLHHRHRILSRETLPHTQKVRYFKALEIEADSMAIKMLVNSGYNFKSAEHFFKKHRDKGEGFHPSSKQRHLNLKIQTDGISKHREGYFDKNDEFVKYKYKKPKLSRIPRSVLDEVSKIK
jgi:predicted Zn-dependent protease